MLVRNCNTSEHPLYAGNLYEEWKESGFLAFQVDVKSQNAQISWICQNLKPLHLPIHVKYFHLTWILCGW